MHIDTANELNRKFAPGITIPFVVAFVSLRHIFHELHEFAHMAAGRLLCGMWGSRDFNNVAAIAPQCVKTGTIDLMVGIAGPLFNYCAIWAGALLIRAASTSTGRAWGLTLIFASLPFARLFTAVIGGGDELGIARTYFADPLMARMATISAVVAILAYPLYAAFRLLAGMKHGVLYFLGLLTLPMLLEGAVVLHFCNYLLKLGLGSEIWLMGSPVLVSILLALALIVFALSAGNIAHLLGKDLPMVGAGELLIGNRSRIRTQ